MTDRVLMLSGGLVHVVHQLAVRDQLGLATAPTTVLFTGVLRLRHPERLEALQERARGWLSPWGIQVATELPEGPWPVVLLNNEWQHWQTHLCEQVQPCQRWICGDGLGLYYRCRDEWEALASSLADLWRRPAAEPGRGYALAGPQPFWHRPPGPYLQVEPWRWQTWFDRLLCSAPPPLEHDPLRHARHGVLALPSLGEEFPGRSLPLELLLAWRRRLPQPQLPLLVLDHPKAPPGGSFGHQSLPARIHLQPPGPEPLEVWLAQRRSQVAWVAGLSSALYGVQQLLHLPIQVLPAASLWRHNPLYRPLSAAYRLRWLRIQRLRWLIAHGSAAP